MISCWGKSKISKGIKQIIYTVILNHPGNVAHTLNTNHQILWPYPLQKSLFSKNNVYLNSLLVHTALRSIKWISMVVTKSLVLIVGKILCFVESLLNVNFHIKDCEPKNKNPTNKEQRTKPAPVSCRFQASLLMDSAPFSTTRSISSPQVSLSSAFVSSNAILTHQLTALTS